MAAVLGGCCINLFGFGWGRLGGWQMRLAVHSTRPPLLRFLAALRWGAGLQGTQHMALNSGLFYLLSNERTISLMKRIDER